MEQRKLLREDAVNVPLHDWQTVIQVNLTSVFQLSQLAGRDMIKRGEGGKIINIASLLSFQGGIRVPLLYHIGLGPSVVHPAIMDRVDSRPLLPTIRCPTLVLVGEQDAATPPALSEEMAAAIPGARLVKIAACGHLSTMERPEAVTKELVAWMEA